MTFQIGTVWHGIITHLAMLPLMFNAGFNPLYEKV